jgi:hypothetical protein
VTMTIMVSTRLPVQRAVAQVTVVTVTPAGEIIIYLFIYLITSPYIKNRMLGNRRSSLSRY